MPLPALNTNYGPDENALNAILQMQKQGATEQYRNALLAEKYRPEKIANENALNVLLTKEKQVETQKKIFDHAREGLNWVQANVENGNTNAYVDYRDHMIKDMGMQEMSLPKPDTFYDSTPDDTVEGGVVQTFNKDRFDKWSNRALATAAEITKDRFEKAKDKFEQKIVYGPENKTMMVPIKKGEEYDPEEELGNGWTFEKPQYETSKEPKVVNMVVGDREVPHQYDAKTETWKPIPGMGGPRWKAGDGEKPEYKQGQALKRMSAIKSATAKLQSGGAIDAIMLAQFPEYAGQMGSEDPQVRKTAIEQLNNEYAYVSKFAPKGTANPKPAPVATPAAGGAPGSKNFGTLWGNK